MRVWLLTIVTVAALSTDVKGFMCPTLFDFYPDPDDCSKFYRCFWGAGYQFDCPTGTLWNHKVLTCDFSYNVDCNHEFWQSSEDYIQEHSNDHTHDYYYDYPNTDYRQPRDDSSQWSELNKWPRENGESEVMREIGPDSQAAESSRTIKHKRPPYDTGSPNTVKITHSYQSTTESMTNENGSSKEVPMVATEITTLGADDQQLKNHLEQLEARAEKPDRKGSRGTFRKQTNSHQSQNANVDYVFYSDKEDSMKSHGRFGYYGYMGKHRSGYYAQPSQRVSFLWPFGKRK